MIEDVRKSRKSPSSVQWITPSGQKCWKMKTTNIKQNYRHQIFDVNTSYTTQTNNIKLSFHILKSDCRHQQHYLAPPSLLDNQSMIDYLSLNIHNTRVCHGEYQPQQSWSLAQAHNRCCWYALGHLVNWRKLHNWPSGIHSSPAAAAFTRPGACKAAQPQEAGVVSAAAHKCQGGEKLEPFSSVSPKFR